MPYGMTWWVEDGYLAVVLAFIWFGLDQRRIATKDIVDRVHKNVFFLVATFEEMRFWNISI